ncbi:hypothetical protein RMSM_02255 [Rhodopirellula maiorica SM1]|uniref:Uncharacterized protein n=1 Tax=Rhodopirellula maiorica SM1 TaxID=1265738 RepID=M5RZK0_9BACT|nr:hypothetical protein RMSM_02255 [Rhodopirellula maiorica SM1]
MDISGICQTVLQAAPEFSLDWPLNFQSREPAWNGADVQRYGS